MLNKVKLAPAGRIIFFSDEKNFTIREAYNCVTLLDSGYVPYPIKYATLTKNPAPLMLLGVIASIAEVSPTVWFKPRETLNSVKYVEILDRTLIPWMEKVAADPPETATARSWPSLSSSRTELHPTLPPEHKIY